VGDFCALEKPSKGKISIEETTMTQSDPAAAMHGLTELPAGSKLRSVTAVPAEVAGRRGLRVELTDAVTLEGKPGVDYVDMPTFVIIPASFTNGTIEVDILSRLNGKGPADARAFAGIAYRVTPGADRFEAVYLRPLNGRRRARPARVTSVPFSTSPTPTGSSTGCASSTRGTTKRARTSALTNWITLKLDIDDTRLTASVNETETLTLGETKAAPVAGAVGLFVDIGSESFFSNLKITPR
jgi:hypothetical protein